MTDAPLDLSPIEDRDAHAECVDLCHQPQADRRALIAEVKRARVRLAAYQAQEAAIRALHVKTGGTEPYCLGCCEVACDWDDSNDDTPPYPCPTLAALDEPEAPT